MVMQNMCFISTINSQYVNNTHANEQLVRIGPYTKVLPFHLHILKNLPYYIIVLDFQMCSNLTF